MTTSAIRLNSSLGFLLERTVRGKEQKGEGSPLPQSVLPSNHVIEEVLDNNGGAFHSRTGLGVF